MRRNLLVVSLLAVSGFIAHAALAAPALDKAGKCRDGGKFVEQKLCETAAAKCRDIKTKKFAKCGTPGTEPVPVTSKPAAAATPPAAATPAAPAKPTTPAK